MEAIFVSLWKQQTGTICFNIKSASQNKWEKEKQLFADK